MKPFITYPISVVRAMTCGSIYLLWFHASLTPTALVAGNAAAKPFSYYLTVPFSSCLLLLLTMTFLHHIMTVPLNWVAAWFPKWVSKGFNPHKHWYWPSWDSWQEGINATIVCLIGIFLCGAFWLIASINQYEVMPDQDKLKVLFGFVVIFNPELAKSLAALAGASLSVADNPKEFLWAVITSDIQKMKLFWLIIATLLYQYLRRDTRPNAAHKSKNKGKKKTQTQVTEVDLIEQRLNQLKADEGATKMNPTKKPSTKA